MHIQKMISDLKPESRCGSMFPWDLATEIKTEQDQLCGKPERRFNQQSVLGDNLV